MYGTFGSNKPLVLIVLLIPAVGLAWMASKYAAPISFPLAGGLFERIDGLFNDWPIGRLWLGTALILAVAAMIAQLCNTHHLHRRENYFAALLSFLFISIHLYWLYFNPIILGLLFLVLTLMRVLTLFRSERITARLYDGGVFMGIAVLIYPPFILVVPILWIALSMLRPFQLREFLIPFAGVLTPVVFTLFYLFWFESTFDLTPYTDFHLHLWDNIGFGMGLIEISLSVLCLAISIIGFLAYVAEMSASTVQKKNTKGVIIVFSSLCLITWLYSNWVGEAREGLGILLVLPFAIFGGYTFSNSERPLLAVISYHVWLALIVVFVMRVFFD